MTDHTTYQHPLTGRYASDDMKKLFSDDKKFGTWRQLWVWLAEAQNELGLEVVTDAKVAAMRTALANPIDYELAKDLEAKFRHDVMAHIHTYARDCPEAEDVIHLGATSMFVNDNADAIIMREGLGLVRRRVVNVVHNLSNFAQKYAHMATLAYTHYQPGQPTTIGKRATLYLTDLLMNLAALERLEEEIPARGVKGTTGTQASFLDLFEGDYERVKELDKRVVKKMSFETSFPVTGQTYTRQMDTLVVDLLGNIAASAHKFAVDMRLAANLKIMEEPRAKDQTGSSAMAYKVNPMKDERMTGLARYVIVKPGEARLIHGNQWMERSLDDSAERRLLISEAFLATDALLNLYENISGGIVVYPAQVRRHLNQELPFMATEAVLMKAVRDRGASRQELHEVIKEHSMAAGKRVKEEGADNDLVARLADDDRVPFDRDELEELMTDGGKFVGAAPQQTRDFLKEHVDPVLEEYKNLIGTTSSSLSV